MSTKLSNPKLKLLGVTLSTLDLSGALDICESRTRAGLNGYACFVNVHSLTESNQSERLRQALNNATFSFMDGMPVKWLARLHGRKIRTRASGPDFMKEFLLKTLDQSHGFVGGAPGQAEEIAAMFGVKGVFYSPPYRSFSSENAVDDWNRFLDLCPNRVPPSCVWVGLGAPKQEFWMQTISPLAPATLFFGVGAAFDFLSGSIKRAPKWMRDSGFEWLYRASQEPKRLFIRYLITNTKFLYLATAELLKRDFYR